MEPDREFDDLEVITDDNAADEPMSVDDFIRELEAKEKDLHITAETTIIEIAQGFDDANAPAFLKDFEVSEAAPQAAAPSPAPAPLPEPKDNSAAEIETLETELTILRGRIAELEAECGEAVQSAQRRLRDFENYRARTERERAEGENARVGGLASQLLPAVDNLDRALHFAAGLPEQKSKEFVHFFEGIELVRRQMGEIFDELGIRAIDAIGSDFDPHFHEAVATEATNEVAPNTVFEELLKGYTVGDLVVRHSMVKVAVAAGDNEPVAEAALEAEDDAIHETEPIPASNED
jgi:molecular chaperone GrpE